MDVPHRKTLCKVQSKSPPDYVYIIYGTSTDRITSFGVIEDFAGVFDTREDADKVVRCLTDIFAGLHDENWQLARYSAIPTGFVDSQDRKYRVKGLYRTRTLINRPQKFQKIFALARTSDGAKKVRQQLTNETRFDAISVIRYKVNDVLPTMYLDDYAVDLHKQKFEHIVDELKSFPHSQDNRRMLRRGAREIPSHILYSDSSDSEDDTKYRPVTSRSLLHTPSRKRRNK